MKTYKVYLIREKHSNKIIYVGITKNQIYGRFISNCSRFKKNSKDYFVELVSENLTVLEAASLERMLISQYKTIDLGWNVSPGSINGFSNEHSEEMKLKWRQTRKGKPVSEDHAKKNRVARLGKKNSEFQKALMSKIKSKPIICVETGEIFSSARKAASALNLQPSKISNVCHGKRKSTGGYTFKFVI